SLGHVHSVLVVQRFLIPFARYFKLAVNDRPALSSFRGGAFGLRPGMRQRRQLGNRRANATMVSRLTAEPGGHWEKSSQRAIFPNVLALGEVADLEALTFNLALMFI